MNEFFIKDDFPKNQIDFDERFADEQSCIEYLFQCKWPDGFTCDICGHTHYWKSARGLYICARCERHQSITAGTIFHGTRKKLTIWFKAMWWFTTRRSGVNAVNLKELLGFGSYETAWVWLQKLRSCTICEDRKTLSVDVEVDEFYIGGKHKGKRGRGAEHKHSVVAAVERKGKKLGRVRLLVTERCSAGELIPFVQNNIAFGSHISTDGWLGYTKLKSLGYGHKQIFQTTTEDKDSVLPGVHLVASLVKRLLLGTFHGRFEKKYLQKYLDEYVFRFNRRNTKSVGKRFYRIVQQAVKTNPMPLKNIMCCNIRQLLAN
jgi:transposase-like protein